jgi:hypothetical protein
MDWMPSEATNRKPIDCVMFVDESGWTGPKVDDEAQPRVFFGGVLVGRRHCTALETAILEAVAAHRNLGITDVKGNLLLKSNKGKKLALELLRCAAGVGAMFVSVGVDKMYMAASMIVHLVHDGTMQPLVKDSQIDSSNEINYSIRPKPPHHIEPPELTDAYYSRLSDANGRRALTEWFRSTWTGKTALADPAYIEAALRNLQAVLDAGSNGCLTLRTLLSHASITAEQREAACSTLRTRLGQEPRVADLFAAFDASTHTPVDSKLWEPGAIAFEGILIHVNEWVHGLSVQNNLPPASFGVAIVQDEPANPTYQGFYKLTSDFVRCRLGFDWIVNHEFARSHERPGVVVADVWTAFSRRLYVAVQMGEEHLWNNIARHTIRPVTCWTGQVAPRAEMARWERYISRQFDENG